ncbi:MAG: glycerol acyltransferase [Muribaculaceae bacterium]|nr:glycerol acyltransferase [Muribaculaceae bacterium]
MKPQSDDKIIRIDLDAVLRSKLQRYYRFIPKSLVAWLKRIVCQDELNALIESNAGRRGADFCAGVLSDLDVSYDVRHADRLPSASDRKVTFVSNHPLGALDGIAIIDMVTGIYGRGVKFVVNDLLMAIEPLSDVFVPINKHGRQKREDVGGVDGAFAADDPVIVFPAGMCSRLDNGEVADLEWQKMFVNKSIENHRTVIPLYFSGENSKFFYKFAKFRKRLGIRLNIEMVRLPREVFLCRGRHFTVTVGYPMEWSTLRGGRESLRQAQAIRQAVYELKEN